MGLESGSWTRACSINVVQNISSVVVKHMKQANLPLGSWLLWWAIPCVGLHAALHHNEYTNQHCNTCTCIVHMMLPNCNCNMCAILLLVAMQHKCWHQCRFPWFDPRVTIAALIFQHAIQFLLFDLISVALHSVLPQLPRAYYYTLQFFEITISSMIHVWHMANETDDRCVVFMSNIAKPPKMHSDPHPQQLLNGKMQIQ